MSESGRTPPPGDAPRLLDDEELGDLHNHRRLVPDYLDRLIVRLLAEHDTQRRAALAVVAFWDGLQAVARDDPRPTEGFRAEMDRRIHVLREAISG